MQKSDTINIILVIIQYVLLKYANYHFSLDLVVGLNDLIATVLNSCTASFIFRFQKMDVAK